MMTYFVGMSRPIASGGSVTVAGWGGSSVVTDNFEAINSDIFISKMVTR